MIIRTSNLAMRFYKRDGWNKEKLMEMIDENGQFNGFKYYADADPYWIPNVGTRMDIDKLMAVTTQVKRGFNDYPHQSDKEHLESKNW